MSSAGRQQWELSVFSQPVCLFVYSGQLLLPWASRCSQLPAFEINMLVAGVPQSPARNKRHRNVVAIQSAGPPEACGGGGGSGSGSGGWGGKEVVVREVNGGGCRESGPVPARSGSSQPAYHPHPPPAPLPPLYLCWKPTQLC